jgi:DNA-directed RNA polymerase subunit RPC12/RpoP
MIEFRCQACGRLLKLPHSYAGKTTECPGCLKLVRVPGAAATTAPVQAPKPAAHATQLCVDCGGAFPAGQMMQHNGQAVCTECFYKRKPVELKYPRKSSRKRRLLLLVLLLAAIGAAAWAVWHFAIR